MSVPGMNSAKARALHRAGLRDPEALAAAQHEDVSRALAAGMAAQMRSRPAAAAGTRPRPGKENVTPVPPLCRRQKGLRGFRRAATARC